jgi:2-hydroxy-3-keto-5-methylthiopentenyl-1-phosphate phosphatase
MRADLVFAKDSLAAYLDQQGRSYTPFRTLGEVTDRLIAGATQPTAAARSGASA